MNKRANFFNFIIFAFLAALLTLSLSAELFARAGKSGGSSSRSSSSRSYGSSSRSYGSGSSYSRSSSYGSGYGSSSYGGSSYGSGYGSSSYGYGSGYRRSYGSGYGSSYYYGRGGGSSIFTILIIVVIAVVVFIVFVFLKNRNNSYDSGDYASGSSFGSANSYGSGGTYGYGSGMASSSFSGGGSGYGRSAVRNPDAEARVRHVFNMVQRAWTERDQYIASDCMSESMFREHKAETDQMISDRERNVLENITIHDINITKFSDDRSSSGYDSGLEPSSSPYGGGRAVMEARITASMIDYVIDENTGSVIDGDANVPDRFTETWRFIKNQNGWVLDEIV